MHEDDIQQDYYNRTAAHYDLMHVNPLDEHGIALSFFVGLARKLNANSILDVGAGTGRGINILKSEFPNANLIGIEPVEGLREIGYQNGIPKEILIEGDGLRIPFEDDSFDFVIETGMLHHVRNPDLVVAEMLRVARFGIMISDSNKFGQGSFFARIVKKFIHAAGLWDAFIWVQTKGKMWKWSEGDGVFYSYSVFDNIDQIKLKFPIVYIANTNELSGYNIKSGSAHVGVMAIKSKSLA